MTHSSNSTVIMNDSSADIEMQSIDEKIDDIESGKHGKIETTVETTLSKSDSNDKSAVKTAENVDPYDVYWDGPDDPENPMNWPGGLRWGMLILISIYTLVSPLASSMFAPGILGVEKDLHFTSNIIAGLVVSIYVLGFAFGPLIVAPLSEVIGRRPVYNCANVLFIIFTILCGLARNTGMLIAFRFLAGCVGITSLVLGGGSIADTTPPERRAGIMSLWAMGPMLGPVIGPIAGGFLAGREGWRWVFYTLAITSAVITFAGFFLLKETYHPVLLERRAAALRKSTGDPNYRSRLHQEGSTKDVFLRAITRPFKLLFRSPICAMFSVFMAFVYALVYLLFTTISEIYIRDYHWSEEMAGLSFLGIGIGSFAGLFVFGFMSKRVQKQHEGETWQPEWRLSSMIPGAIAIPIGLFIYGWAAQYHVQFVVPMIGTGFVGFGMITTFMAITTYLVDAFGIYAASATAACTILRYVASSLTKEYMLTFTTSILGAVLPLAGGPLYTKLGLGWGNSLLAFISLALVPLPFLFLKWGKHIREHYPVKL